MTISSLSCQACGSDNQPQAIFCTTCGTPIKADAPSPRSLTGLLLQDQLLKQQYRILRQIGRGGFAAVYKAEDTQFNNRLVAIKEMSQSGLSQEELTEAVEAFGREAQMLASLQHPHLPRIYDHFSEKGRWYFVMDFIEGETLEAYLLQQPEQRLSLEATIDIGLQLCSVLDYLHTRQPSIIFRDLKPANIMRTPSKHLYLIDLGIARHFKPGQVKDTVPFGSPGYAAPEQYGKAQTTPRSDIYSLGVLLHHLLSSMDPSEKPFIIPPLQLYMLPGAAELENLIMEMTQLDPEKRPTHIDNVQEELQHIAALTTGNQINIPSRSLTNDEASSNQPMANRGQVQTQRPLSPATLPETNPIRRRLLIGCVLTSMGAISVGAVGLITLSYHLGDGMGGFQMHHGLDTTPIQQPTYPGPTPTQTPPSTQPIPPTAPPVITR